MALGSQKTNVQAMSNITGLVHEIFVGDVLPAVRWESVTAQLFGAAGEGDPVRLPISAHGFLTSFGVRSV